MTKIHNSCLDTTAARCELCYTLLVLSGGLGGLGGTPSRRRQVLAIVVVCLFTAGCLFDVCLFGGLNTPNTRVP